MLLSSQNMMKIIN